MGELMVEAGGLTLGTEDGITFAAPGRDPYPAARLKFNCNMRSLRAAFAQLRYTPAPALFHGVVLLRITITMQATLQSTKCALGLVVHAVNTAPAVLVNQTHILQAQGSGFLRSRPNHLLGPVLQFTDPDALSESEWFKA